MNSGETRAAVAVVANNFVRLVLSVADLPTRRKLRKLFQSCIEFLHIWIQQQPSAPSSGDIFAVVKCHLLQSGISNNFIALLEPYMPCTHAQDSAISDHFDFWEVMCGNRSPSPTSSPTTPSRKRSSSDCLLAELSPLCNRQLFKHFRSDTDR